MTYETDMCNVVFIDDQNGSVCQMRFGVNDNGEITINQNTIAKLVNSEHAIIITEYSGKSLNTITHFSELESILGIHDLHVISLSIDGFCNLFLTL